MPGPTKTAQHAKQDNTPHNEEKKQATKTEPALMQVIKLVGKDMKQLR